LSRPQGEAKAIDSLQPTGFGTEEWGTYRPQGISACAIQLTRNRIVRGALRRFLGNHLKDASLSSTLRSTA
jgi:hypothetical protein